MAYNALNNLIDAYIYANGVQAITGQILNGVLKQMVSQLGSGYHLMGVAGPETTPASNDFAMAYFAATAGEYTDFGGITLAAGEVAVLLTSGNGSWSKQTVYNVPTGTADLENTANFITNAVTDLVNYYTKTEVDDTLANYPTLEDLATALADYYTKTEIDTILAGYITNTALASALADYYNKNDIDGLLSVVNAALADRYTKSETDTKLADYYKKTETYDKDEVDSIVATLSRQEYIVAWDGLAAPDVSAIPSGVTVTYSGTTYTGTLDASASTVNKIYMVWNGTAYDMYGTSQDGGYSWVPMGTTTVDLSQYATKAELNQLEHKVDELGYDAIVDGQVTPSLTLTVGYIMPDGTTAPASILSYSAPIRVFRGDVISVVASSGNSQFAVISETNESATSYNPKVLSVSNQTDKLYTYTVTEDVYIAICGKTVGATLTCTIARYLRARIVESVNNLEHELIELIGMVVDPSLLNNPQIGDVYYNTSTKKLYQKVSESSPQYQQVPYIAGSVYTYDGKLFVCVSNELKQVTFNLDVTPTRGNENNVVSSDGIAIGIARAVANGGFLYISIRDSSNIAARLSAGEWGWNTSDNTIVYKYDGTRYYSFAPTKSGVIYYNGDVYQWDGTKFDKLSVNEIEAIKLTIGEQLNCDNTVSPSIDNFPYRIVQGHKYLVTNTSNIQGNFSTINSSNTTVDSLGVINGGESKEFTASGDAVYIRCPQALTFTIIDTDGLVYRTRMLEGKVEKLDVSFQYDRTFDFTNADNLPYHFIVGKRYRVSNLGNVACTVSTRITENGSNAEKIADLYAYGNRLSKDVVEFIPSVEAFYIRCAQSTTIKVEYLDALVPAVEELQVKTKKAEETNRPPYVQFDFNDYALKDWSTELSDIDFTANDFPEQIVDLFDALLSANPSFVTKEDALTFSEIDGLSYPAYANLEGQASGDYLATPTYRTYIYKFSDASAVDTDISPKKKLFLVCGTHGNEIAAPFNAYLFAKQLCNVSDENFYKLRSTFDIYIIPVINGYGMYHKVRYNGNGVDLNRNYPIKAWVLDGTAYEVGYSGPSAGSEFETKLVMACCQKIKPDVAIDHHNYAKENTQFYVDAYSFLAMRTIYPAYVNSSIAFQKELPQYFGSSFKMIKTSSAPKNNLSQSATPTTAAWFAEKGGVELSATLEISQCINFDGGVYEPIILIDNYGSDTFAVADYTFKQVTFHLMQKALCY